MNCCRIESARARSIASRVSSLMVFSVIFLLPLGLFCLGNDASPFSQLILLDMPLVNVRQQSGRTWHRCVRFAADHARAERPRAIARPLEQHRELVAHVLARRLLFWEFALQAVHVIHTRTDFGECLVCRGPDHQPAKSVPKQHTERHQDAGNEVRQ
jgi:hypothetical protein